jgi:hypothetical protein
MLAVLFPAPAGNEVAGVVLVGDGFPAFFALGGSGFAALEVRLVVGEWDIELAVFAEFGHSGAAHRVLGEAVGLEGLLAVLAWEHLMELALVLFLVIDVVELPALGTWLYVLAAVPEVGAHLRFRHGLLAVLASLQSLHCFTHLLFV